MTDTALSDEPIFISDTEMDGPNGLKINVRSSYTPSLAKDPRHMGFELFTEKAVKRVLVYHYFGYDWRVDCDATQGVVLIHDPELMGPTLKIVILLRDLMPDVIKELAGQVLERMGLRRGPMDPAEYFVAKARMHTFQFNDVPR